MCPSDAAGCPICRTSASSLWIDDRGVFLVECENCTTFTITPELVTVFQHAWLTNSHEPLMRLEALSRYLRLGGDDCDREVTAENWMLLAAESPDDVD
jgi:hypothetical protein